jgi:hypothetical protein
MIAYKTKKRRNSVENVTLQEIIEYKEGEKSSTLNMAMSFNMPYIAEKEIAKSSAQERILMAAELITKYNGRALYEFLSQIIDYPTAYGLINNVSLLTLAKTMENEMICEYLNQYEATEQGTEEETLAVINTFNGGKEVTPENKLNFFLGEVTRIRSKK